MASPVEGGRPAAGEGDQAPRSGQVLGFAVATAGYLSVTTNEALLAPVVPVVRDELGISIGTTGLALGLLSLAIAAGNLLGGLVLARWGAKRGIVAGVAVSAAGGLATALSHGRLEFLLAQVLVGLGSGTFFAPGLQAVGVLGGTRRRGLAMGLFGVAFSGGLALAALLAALADAWGWRLAYGSIAALAAVVACGCALTGLPSTPAGGGMPRPLYALRRLLRRPMLVGGVASASQYGTIAFLPTFAVAVWGMSPAGAALALTAARLLSVPAKLASGNATDAAGTFRIARRLGLVLAVLGVCWTVLPGPGPGLWAAVVFAALVSGLGPVANVLAFDSYGTEGMLLGAFRSVQIGLGAATSALIGGVSAMVGLRPTIAVAVLLPVVLLPIGMRGWRERRARAAREEREASGASQP